MSDLHIRTALPAVLELQQDIPAEDMLQAEDTLQDIPAELWADIQPDHQQRQAGSQHNQPVAALLVDNQAQVEELLVLFHLTTDTNNSTYNVL